MLIFLIIEAARILWAWGTVQSAARAGARYAITGNYDTNCATQGMAKYDALCSDLDLLRPASVIAETHRNLVGLPLNEDPNSVFEDNDYYSIEIFGVDQLGQLRGTNLPAPVGPDPFAGAPNQPVIVRVLYRVPIITPFFSPILPSIPVFGQTTLYNEPFGQLGGTGESAGVPPPIPALPTPGVTPSFTPTPTPGASNTPTNTPTNTATATRESCPVRWTSGLAVSSGLASVTGLYDNNGTAYVVNFFNYTNDPSLISPIGSATMVQDTGNVHACPGVGNATLTLSASDVGDTVRVVHPDGTFADIIVQGQPDTPTPTPSNTPTATLGPTATNTPTSTPIPTYPFIDVVPRSCAMAPSTTVIVNGLNWDPNEVVSIFINGRLVSQQTPNSPNGDFSISWRENVSDGNNYTVSAISNSASHSSTFTVPCTNVTPTPVVATPTNTPIPADLKIGLPVLISTPPIEEYQPVSFQVAITNDGEVDVNSQFFVDIFIDPTVVYSDHIPIGSNPAYSAVGSLLGGASRVITITSEIGFTGGATDREVYSMVDSLQGITEGDENNNISGPIQVTVIPGTPPAPTPTPDGNSVIAGRVRFLIGNWVQQQRVQVFLINNDTGMTIASQETNSDGYYQFDTISDTSGGYRALACFNIDNSVYVGDIPVVHPPNSFATIFLTTQQASCH